MKKFLKWLVIVVVLGGAFCWYKGIGPFAKAPAPAPEPTTRISQLS